MAIRLALLLSAALPAAWAGDLPGFRLWRAAELQARDSALSSRITSDNSARETLGEYGNHRLRLIYRASSGPPEQHDKIVDIWFVLRGAATLAVGGKMLEPVPSEGPGEWLGAAIAGGERPPIEGGDILHIPVTMPHGPLVAAGQHVTYVNLRVFSGETWDFHLWTRRELGKAAAAATSDADLGMYDSHRIRLRRVTPEAKPEVDKDHVETWFVQSGEGTLEIAGESHAIGKGDIVHIPAAVSHRIVVSGGASLTYVGVSVQAR
jgi:mannose-6-phosphate isomerase-like protein (cupin superfamily)